MHSSEKCSTVFHILDIFINLLLISPLVVFFWRGTWEIMDVYVFPGTLEFSAWISFGIGNVIILIASLLQGVLSSAFKRKKIYGPWRVVISRIYLYIFAFGCVNQWRGIWFVIDHYTGKSWESCAISIAVGYCILTVLRCSSSTLASPLTFNFDEDHQYFFVIPGLLKSEPGWNPRFILGAFLSVIIINNLVVSFWRGVWVTTDLFLEPNDIFTSGLYSLCISCGLIVPILLMESPVKKLSSKLKENNVVLQFLIEAIYLLFSSLVPIFHWRGIWLLQDAKLIPENKPASVWTSHAIGFCGLTVFLAFKSVTTASCYLDYNIHNLDVTLFQMTYIKRVYQCINTRMRSYDLNTNLSPQPTTDPSKNGPHMTSFNI